MTWIKHFSRSLLLAGHVQRSLRHAIRLLRRSPAFAFTALATLAICLGANLAIFAVVDAVLVQPLPFPAADRLVGIFNTYPRAGVPDDGSSVTNYYERRGQLPAFASLALYREGTAIVGEARTTEREEVMRVTPDFFLTLGSAPIAGRSFTDAEMSPQTDAVAILSDQYWRQRLDGAPDAVGRPIRINGEPHTIVGVLPPGFRLLSSGAGIYLPLGSSPDARAPRQRHSGSSSRMIARLAPGISLAEAQSQIDAHNSRVEEGGPQARMMADAGFRSQVVPLHAHHVAAVRPTLLLLQAGALLLLLIGAVNLVNLLLIRASGRLKEMAVRQALGAGRRHILAEVLVETTLLGAMGGVLGLVAGAGGMTLLALLGADHLPLGARVAFSTRLALAALGGALMMGIAIGVPVAWYTLRSRPGDALHSETRGGTAGRTAQRLRHGFLVAQMALAFVLLASAGLLGVSLNKVVSLSPGFRADHVLSGRISLPAMSYPDGAALVAFTERLAEAIARQPGVLASGVTTNVPFSGQDIKSAATAAGHVLAPGESPRGHYGYGVTGDYFAAMGLSLKEGRFLEAADSRRAERVCVVDNDFARHYWPERSAIGQRVYQGGGSHTEADAFTVVGVVARVKQASLTEADALGAVYFPFAHRLDRTIYVVTRTHGRPEALGAALQNLVRTVDPELPVSDLRSMDTRIADSLVTRRSPALLAGLFSAIALLLTAIGVYGVLSYAVEQRRREIGLRMALGAQPAQVRRQFLSTAVRLMAAGTVLGFAGAWAAGHALQAILFDVPPLHAMTLAGTASLLCLVSLVACLLPSHRAARTSPLQALNEG